MANEILNTDGTTSGNQTQGRAYVNTGGRGSYALLIKSVDTSAGLPTTTVLSIADKYDDRFDKHRYYTGDTDA